LMYSSAWRCRSVDGNPLGRILWSFGSRSVRALSPLLSFVPQLAQLLQVLSDLAVRTKDFVLPGRTHGQHALPATFGFKVSRAAQRGLLGPGGSGSDWRVGVAGVQVAMWIDEICRHVERLRQCNPRLFVAMLGGGAGTYASFGDKGPAIQARMGQVRDKLDPFVVATS
jgi:3-carboxy-cis,cis-muconate cycloisomerase